MTSDLQALLAAIVADPADDTARLVYADCLQEHGNNARAEFIRLQVEAERLHPHSNARAAMEDRARALFEQNWVGWWNEVCAATGFEPADYRMSESGTAIREAFPESPYDDFDDLIEPQRPRALLGGVFRRGFPESVGFSSVAPNRETVVANFDRWQTVSPLVEFVTHAWPEVETNWWPDAPFLRTVTALEFNQLDLDVVGRAFRSPHLANVERLTIRPNYPAPGTRLTAARVALAAPFAAQLKHLSVPLQNAESLASGESLTHLESLEVTNNYPEVVGIAALMSGPGLANLRRLTIRSLMVQGVVEALCREPVCARLRSLELGYWGRETSLHALATADLPELEECRLRGLNLTHALVRELVRAPLLKRVKHLALLDGNYNDGRALLPLVDAVDPARIETFAIGVPYFPERAADALRAKFGDRFRLLPT